LSWPAGQYPCIARQPKGGGFPHPLGPLAKCDHQPCGGHSVESTLNNAKEAQNQKLCRIPIVHGMGRILETAQNKETHSVDVFLVIFLIKNDRPQNGRLRDGATIPLNYKSFSA
jgi:hypothetical protein